MTVLLEYVKISEIVILSCDSIGVQGLCSVITTLLFLEM